MTMQRLSYVCKHFKSAFEQTNSHTGKLNDVKLVVDDLDLSIRDAKEEIRGLKFRLDTIESSIPKMVRELIDFYAEQKVNPRFENLLTRKEHKDAIALKLDYVVFNDYVKS